MITPQIHVDTIDFKRTVLFFKTYRELKKNLKRVFEEYGVRELYVLRSRRGMWGEWFEYWEYPYTSKAKEKPYITNSGWN